MKKFNLEFIVGLFFLIGFLGVAYMSVKITDFNFQSKIGYKIKAEFDNVGGLKAKARVEIAGVPIGVIKEITLDGYRAQVVMQIGKGINIPDDSIASIKTKGLLGEKFLEISPGASEVYLESGSEIIDTQSPIDFEKALGKYIFGNLK